MHGIAALRNVHREPVEPEPPRPGFRAAAFERVFRADHAALVAFCFRRIGDHELARDVAAEAFRIAWSASFAAAAHGAPARALVVSAHLGKELR